MSYGNTSEIVLIRTPPLLYFGGFFIENKVQFTDGQNKTHQTPDIPHPFYFYR
jgi:hypothetical protein